MHNNRFGQSWRSVCSILVCCVWLGSLVHAQEQSDQTRNDGLEIAQLLNTQADAWNKGDLEKFMETYWKSEKLTFSSGGKTTYGWKATLENYRKSYAPPNDMGKLKFDHLDIIRIETNSALVLGQWHLKMKDESNRDGNFSLVVKRLSDGWKIIHDHSSKLEPETQADHSEPKK